MKAKSYIRTTGVWPEVLAICEVCNRDASETRITRYVEYAISKQPLRCDQCLEQKQ